MHANPKSETKPELVALGMVVVALTFGVFMVKLIFLLWVISSLTPPPTIPVFWLYLGAFLLSWTRLPK